MISPYGTISVRQIQMIQELSRAEILVYLVLTAHAGKSGLAWPSVATMTTITGLSARSVRRGLSGLRKSDLISALEQPGKPTRYSIGKTMVPAPVKKLALVPAPVPAPVPAIVPAPVPAIVSDHNISDDMIQAAKQWFYDCHMGHDIDPPSPELVRAIQADLGIYYRELLEENPRMKLLIGESGG